MTDNTSSSLNLWSQICYLHSGDIRPQREVIRTLLRTTESFFAGSVIIIKWSGLVCLNTFKLILYLKTWIHTDENNKLTTSWGSKNKIIYMQPFTSHFASREHRAQYIISRRWGNVILKSLIHSSAYYISLLKIGAFHRCTLQLILRLLDSESLPLACTMNLPFLLNHFIKTEFKFQRTTELYGAFYGTRSMLNSRPLRR